MSRITLSTHQFAPTWGKSPHRSINYQDNSRFASGPALAASITRQASTQTYWTIRALVDRPLVADAYRAYAYFRWVDDVIDKGREGRSFRLAFLARQREIIARCSRGEWPLMSPEESMVAFLIHNDQGQASGLRTYIDEMMKVMHFDADRKGRLIGGLELAEYTRSLATAVTEALHHFIGHGDPAPRDDSRYAAVTGAHITHMLRDAIEDGEAGYYNIPVEFLGSQDISPTGVDQVAYQFWVKSRVELAREQFARGRAYLARLQNPRRRLAGFAYVARFEVVLEAIEKDGFLLRASYPERKSKGAALKMGLTALAGTFGTRGNTRQSTASRVIPSPEAS